MCAICCQLLWNIPRGIKMVSVCTLPARGGRSCERFGGYKTINRIPLPVLRLLRVNPGKMVRLLLVAVGIKGKGNHKWCLMQSGVF